MGLVCLHNHLVPGVDDGAGSAAEADEALASMREQGIDLVVATPHVDASLTSSPRALQRRMAEIDRGWRQLHRVAGERGVRAGRGAEILLDSPRLELDDPRLRLAGARAVLVELPWGGFPTGVEEVLYRVRMDGFLPVLAHPERYREFHVGDDSMERLRRWSDSGVALQVNAGSLTGQYGRRVRKVAWKLLYRGLAHLVSSDHHPRPGRVPAITEAWKAVARRGGDDRARALFSENARRILRGEDPQVVPSLPARRLAMLLAGGR